MTEAPGDDALGRQLVAQARAIAELRQELHQVSSNLTDSVAETVTRVDALEDAADGSPDGKTVMAWCWRYIGPQGAESLWGELTDWVDWVRGRYPLARRIPECWGKHPEVVEELTALWLAWCAAYTERGAPLTGASDWHDRWLPGVLYRLEHGAFALDCAREHHERPASAYCVQPKLEPGSQPVA